MVGATAITVINAMRAASQNQQPLPAWVSMSLLIVNLVLIGVLVYVVIAELRDGRKRK